MTDGRVVPTAYPFTGVLSSDSKMMFLFQQSKVRQQRGGWQAVPCRGTSCREIRQHVTLLRT